MRTPEPHELKAAKREANYKAGYPIWDELSGDEQAEYVAQVSRILRAAGRGGKAAKLHWDGDGCACSSPCTRHCEQYLILGPARRAKNAKG